MTNIPETLLEQVPEWDFETLYEHFDLLEPEAKIKKKVDEGINIKFPVEILINGDFEDFPKHSVVRVHGRGFGKVNRFKFMTEVRERKKIMLKFIYDNYNQDITKSRVEEER